MGEYKTLIQEMTSFCYLSGIECLKRFELVKAIILTEFYQPEFDIPRKEIARCYVVAAYQACITLTNHLERYCKMLLINYESGFKSITDLKSLEKIFEEANSRWSNKDLNVTLKACKKFGLISKEDWKVLDGYRDKFRNGFSHSDAEKIFGNTKGGFVLGKFGGSMPNEFQELTYSKIPFLQGIIIEDFSKENALPYFIEVENLIRKTINHIQADEYKVKYQLIRLVPNE
jgi:hypothetical protein